MMPMSFRKADMSELANSELIGGYRIIRTSRPLGRVLPLPEQVSPHVLSRSECLQIRRLYIGKLNAKLGRAQTLCRPEMEEGKRHDGIHPFGQPR
jgi:hypothetical protein